jgi:hypothetical protein
MNHQGTKDTKKAEQTLSVVAGLVPAIHAVPPESPFKQGAWRTGVGARHKAGHDEI